MNGSTATESISVALCTYNGARFLELQLASLLAQTRSPDELVVCDDGSTDATLAILKEFASTAPFPVRIHCNPINLGSNKNFDQAMRLCTGSLIAFCDQDDVWLAARLAAGAAALRNNPRLGLIFSNGELIDDVGSLQSGLLWDNFHFGSAIREQIWRGDMLPLVRYRFVTGATVMMRARLREYICPPPGEWIHDGWIAALVACVAGVGFLQEPLIQYRRHALQQVGTGVGPQSTPYAELARQHWLGADWHRTAIGQVLACVHRIPVSLRTATADDFAQQFAFLSMRLTLPARFWLRPPHMAAFRGDYARRARGWKSMLMDLLLPKQQDETGSAAAQEFSALQPHRSRPGAQL